MTTNHDALRAALIEWADIAGISIGSADGGPYPTLEQLAQFAAIAASKPEPQAQGEPEDDLTIAYMAGFSKGKDQMREALAVKDAEIAKLRVVADVALEALEESLKKGFESNWPAHGRVAAAITKIKEALDE